MRSANGGPHQCPSTTEQNGCNDTRMWVLVPFGADSNAQAKADEGSNQSVAPVAGLPPHSPIAPPAWISYLERNRRDGSALGEL